MDTMSQLGISKAASFRSLRRGSVQPTPSHHPSEGRKSAHTASSRAALLHALSNNNNNTDFDRASETSSMEERRYAELLGPDRDPEPFPEFGEVHEPKNVGHRLYICGVAQQKAREERLRAKRERIILRELNELTTKPSITNHARQKPSKGSMFADHSEEWLQRRDERLVEIAAKVRREREKELTASPCINRRSAEIAESSGYRGPVEGWEDHFAKYYAKKSCATLQAPPPGMFTPNVNHSYRLRNSSASAGLNASASAADVSARLYEDAITREEKQQALKEEAEVNLTRDPFTNKLFFTPSRVDYPLNREDCTPVEASMRLHALHEEKQQKQQEKLKELERAIEESKFKPAINPRSVELGERRRRPLYERRDHSKSLNVSTADRSVATTTTTTDGGDKKKKTISTARVEDFLRRNEFNLSMRQQRMERIRSEAHERETGECTFKPAVNRKSMEIFYEINQYGADLSDHAINRSQARGAAARGSLSYNNSYSAHHLDTPAAGPLSSVAADGASTYADRLSAKEGGGGSTAVSTPRVGGGTFHADSVSSALGGGGAARIGGGFSPSASPIYGGRGANGGGGAYHRDPQSNLGHPNGKGNGSPRSPHHQDGPASPRRRGGAANGTDAQEDPSGASINDFARQFEAQMFQVLDDWRRLEDV